MNGIKSREQRFVERENKKVLDAATGNNDSESNYAPIYIETETDILEVSISSTLSTMRKKMIFRVYAYVHNEGRKRAYFQLYVHTLNAGSRAMRMR